MKSKKSSWTGAPASALIAAAGLGSRMGTGVNKQFIMLDDMPVLAHTLLAFDSASQIDEVIVVTQETEILTVSDLVKDFGIRKVKGIVPGGATRQESVRLGLSHVTCGKVLIHDGARPFVTPEQIDAVADQLESCDAAALGIPVKDTIKRVGVNGLICETLERDGLFQIQTPQGFRTEVIKKAHAQAALDEISVTDDCALAEYIGIPVRIVTGSAHNLKVTTPEDLVIAEALLLGKGMDCSG